MSRYKVSIQKSIVFPYPSINQLEIETTFTRLQESSTLYHSPILLIFDNIPLWDYDSLFILVLTAFGLVLSFFPSPSFPITILANVLYILVHVSLVCFVIASLGYILGANCSYDYRIICISLLSHCYKENLRLCNL